jgi:tRNA pseudouridine65 synthase
VRGWVETEGEIDYALPPDEGKPRAPSRTLFRRMAEVELPHPVGRYATARYSLLELRPLTGRLHQLRRHMAHVRHPIVGDVTHGDSHHNRFFRGHLGVRRLLLHSHSIRFPHPTSNAMLEVRAPVDEEMERVLEALGMAKGATSAVRTPRNH